MIFRACGNPGLCHSFQCPFLCILVYPGVKHSVSLLSSWWMQCNRMGYAWVPRMLPVVQDDSLCMPIITWNSLTPPPPKKKKQQQQYFPTHRLRFKTPLKHLKSQVIGQETCLNVYTGTKLAQNFREKWLLLAGQLGRSDSQIGRSYSAKLRHFLSF